MTAGVFCEQSGVWSRELVSAGFDVVQVDLELPAGARRVGPRWLQCGGDARPLLQMIVEGHCSVDVVVAFPPCTDLAWSGVWCMPRKDVYGGIAFATLCAAAAARARVAGLLENPVGLLGRVLGAPSMIVHPWQFCESPVENLNKRTCLWLYGWPFPFVRWSGSRSARSFVDRLGPSADRAMKRSIGWVGMANAFVSVLRKDGA